MFYIFHGDDTHSQRETLARLKSQLGAADMLDLNTTRLDGKGLQFSQLRHACDSMPFLAPKRLVIVENLLSSSPDKTLLDDLLGYLPTMPDTARLVFLEEKSVSARSPLLKLAESAENGYSKAFSLPEGAGLERWIRGRAEQLNGRLSPRATQMLAANVGSDLRTLDNEIEKLVLYKGEGETVEAEDVTRLCPYVAESSIFDLVDALGGRNGRQAALLLQRKINEGTDPFFLFAMFVRQFRLLIQVKELADSDVRPPAIAKQLKIHSFVAGKLYQQSGQFSLSQLEQIYAHLLDIDIGVKTGRTDMSTALDLLVVGLAH